MNIVNKIDKIPVTTDENKKSFTHKTTFWMLLLQVNRRMKCSVQFSKRKHFCMGNAEDCGRAPGVQSEG